MLLRLPGIISSLHLLLQCDNRFAEAENTPSISRSLPSRERDARLPWKKERGGGRVALGAEGKHAAFQTVPPLLLHGLPTAR